MEIYVGGAEVKSTSVFQAKQLYIMLHEWCLEHAYAKPGDVNFPETMFWEARSQNIGSEYWIWWRTTKQIEGNQFWHRAINIDFHGVGMKNVEVMYKGKKIKADKGKYELLFQAKLVIDRDGMWAKHPLLKPFLEIFWKRLFNKEIEMYRKEVMNDLRTLQDICRQWFQIGALTFTKDQFMPEKGYDEGEP